MRAASVRELLNTDAKSGVGGHVFALILAAVFGLGALSMPLAAASVDEALYIEMARAMAERGGLAIATDGGVPGAPTLVQRFTHAVHGQSMPQYPGGYAIIAAPFYVVFGVKGLVLLNALSAVAAALMTKRICGHLYGDREMALLAAALLAGATFLSTYAVAIWPHALALALVLAGVERVLAGLACRQRCLLAVGGLFFGLAVNVRVDVVLAVLAIFFWLRLFAAPSKRSVAVVFLLGLLPGLALATWINWAKFGVLSPIAYAPPDGRAMSARYIEQSVIISSAAAAAMLVDVSRLRPTFAYLQARPTVLWAGLGLSFALCLAASDGARTLLWNTYALVVDLQQLDDARFQQGVVRLDNGLISFWGTTKAALLQSVPFAVLAAIPALHMFQGKRAREHALSLAMIAGPVLFYSLTQWHGGLSSAMRYFLPCLPFLAILSAFALRDLAGDSRFLSPAFVRGLLLGGAGVMALAGLSLSWSLGLRYALEVYAPLVITGALLLAAMLVFANPGLAVARTALQSLAGLAVACAAVLSLGDLGTLHSRLSTNAAVSERLADITTPGSLVLTTTEEWLFRAQANGVEVYNPRAGAEAVQAATAFAAAGRCVFVYPDYSATDLQLSPSLYITWMSVEGLPHRLGVIEDKETEPAMCAQFGGVT